MRRPQADGGAGRLLIFSARMIELFYLLLIEQILQGLYSLWQGIAWLRMARRHAGQPAGFYTPRVAVICPVKGLETGLEENLAALANFDYAQYELFLSIASAEDPAYRLLERLAANSKRQVHIIRAGPPKDCGEKVNNLRVGRRTSGPGIRGTGLRRFRRAAASPLAGPHGGAAGRSARRRGHHVPLAAAAARRILERAGFGVERFDRHVPGRARSQLLLGRRRGHPARPIRRRACHGGLERIGERRLLDDRRPGARRPSHRFCARMPGGFPGGPERVELFRVHQSPAHHHARVLAETLADRRAGPRVLLRGAFCSGWDCS